MDVSTSSVLITGGGTGIGLALAARFLAAGSDVMVCGRRESALLAARERHPRLRTRVCDVSRDADRRALVDSVTHEWPAMNVLVNNAGIQRRTRVAEPEPWDGIHEEIAINLEASIHLSLLMLPHLQTRSGAAIVNVTSGLAFAPLAATPIYCATKAAMHSFTLSLRRQLAATPIRVVEIIPPAVDTDLGGPGLHTFGVNVDEFADAAFARLTAGELEIAIGFADQASRASREQLDAMFERMNG